jgi:fibronectin-binding autotransporter adhesin
LRAARWTATWLLAGASLATLSSSANAACSGDHPPTNIVAIAGDNCTVTGGYHATEGPAMQATGNSETSAVIHWTPLNAATSISTSASAPAVEADSYGTITLSPTPFLGNVTTTADNAPGLSASGVNATITASGVVVTTGDPTGSPGAFSYGVFAGSGGGVSFDGGSITTFGSNAAAVLAETGEGGGVGSITLTGSTTILTAGSDSSGLMVAGAGSSVNATDVGVKTISSGSAGAYNGFDAHALGGGSLSLTNATIVTLGDDANGVVTNGGGQTTITGGSINVGGLGSKGLFVAGAGSSLTATGAEISTTGGRDTEAGVNPIGAYNGSGPGYATGGSLTLTNTSVSTTGFHGDGVVTADEGVTTITGGSVMTGGNSAYGVISQGGGKTTLAGTTISTTGDGSGGLGVNGAGSRIDASNVTVSTSGGYDSTTTLHAYGAYNGPFGSFTSGGILNLTGGSVSTGGAQMYAVFTATGGVTTINGASIMTSGSAAAGVVTTSGGSTAMNGGNVSTIGNDASAFAVNGNGSGAQASFAGTTTLTTTGDGAIGLHVLNNGTVTASGGQVNISTTGTNSESTGLSAFGVFADGEGASIQLAGANVMTTGEGAVGLYASLSQTETNRGGAITITGPLSVTTGGTFAYGAWAENPGATISLEGPSVFTINGSAYGLLATNSGAITTSDTLAITANGPNGGGVEVNDSGSLVTLKGTTIVTTNGASDAGLLAAYGGSLSLQGPTTVAVNGPNSVGVGATSGAITATGALNVTTSQASSVAFLLSGASPTLAATGGGTVTTAGTALVFRDATNASATFDNFTFNGASGDLIFADPSVATLNFNATVANAGAGNLLNATQGSTFTLNASASRLTGAIQTDATSITNVNLTNSSLWTLTGSSFVSNLVVTTSGVAFAPSGGGQFNTLTVNNWLGSGASLLMNATLGGANSTADQLVVSGGKATGSTQLTIRNIGGTGGQTTGSGILLISAINGGSLATNAFALSSIPVVNGYKYTLSESANAWYLVSSPASTQSDIVNSVSSVARSQQQLIVTNRVLSSILLGATEQVNCSNCSSGFGSIGSFAIGAHGRWALSDQLTVMGGFAYSEYSGDGVEVTNAPMFAGSLIYDMTNLGRSRPFFEVGGALTPYSDVSYSRSYVDGTTVSSGYGKTVGRNAAVFARAGWVSRVTPIDEAAVYADISRSWLQTGGYTEASNADNPFPMTVASGLDTLDIARAGAQWTHLFNGVIEANVSAAVAYGFDPTDGSQVNVASFGGVAPYPLKNSTWLEYGARVGYRFGGRMVVDGFIIGTAGGEVGRTLHGGIGLRYLF